MDIGTGDLISGMLACCRPSRRDSLERQAEQAWSDHAAAVITLSVRSGFDLILSSLHLPPRSKVLMSALTVPDMERIARHHGLEPLPFDLVRDGCTPSLESLERAITPDTRILVVAHLFGTRVEMDPIIAFARRHHLFVIEDCAQAYDGARYHGHPESDAALFSFGPIKTATALGGGVVRLKSTELSRRVREIQRSYEVQSRRSYFYRLAKYTAFKLLSTRPLLALVLCGCRHLGVDFDALVAGAARNFPTDHLLYHLRRQPSAPLLRMLLRRWRHYDERRLAARVKMGRELVDRLPPEVLLSDWRATFNNYWVFPVLVDDPQGVVALLRQNGLDATARTRLAVVSPPVNRPDLQPLNIAWTLARIVFVPWYPDLPAHVLDRIARVIRDDGIRSRHESRRPGTAPTGPVPIPPPSTLMPLTRLESADSQCEGVV